MGYIKDLLFIFLDLLGFGSAGIQIAVAVDELIKTQEKTIENTGLTATHEEFLFWFNIGKGSILFILSAVYIGFRIYGYYKKNIK